MGLFATINSAKAVSWNWQNTVCFTANLDKSSYSPGETMTATVTAIACPAAGYMDGYSYHAVSWYYPDNTNFSYGFQVWDGWQDGVTSYSYLTRTLTSVAPTTPGSYTAAFSGGYVYSSTSSGSSWGAVYYNVVGTDNGCAASTCIGTPCWNSFQWVNGTMSCGAWCGDGSCNNGENCFSCSTDCGSCGGWCGDGSCNNGETSNTCPQDCPPASPPTLSFWASPDWINQGGDSVLYWNVSNADNCTGYVGDFAGGKNNWNDNYQVWPWNTTTYEMECWNSYGSSGREYATVNVNAGGSPPTLSFWASPDWINQGGDSVLYWNVSNADNCTGYVGDFAGGKNNWNDNYQVWPWNTTTYEMECWNSYGSSGREYATVNVNAGGGSYTLSTSVSTGGVVTSAPAGINCNQGAGTCSATFTLNSSVTLTAASLAGNHFVGWGGDCSGTNTTCNLTMNAAKTVSADFASNCIPNTSCAAMTCIDKTCSDGCGGTVDGTKVCSGAGGYEEVAP